MQLPSALCCYLSRRGNCTNLHEADHSALIFGYQEALLFDWREGQLLDPERLQTVEQA
jgi:hypothetical protein